MNFTITYLKDVNQIKLHYTGDDFAYVEFVDVDAHYGIYKNTMTKNVYSSCNVGNREKIRIFIAEKNKNFYVFDAFVDCEDEYFQLVDLTKYGGDYDFNKPICFITGHAGGGTSIVAKAFRKLGINLGDDCGNFNKRKPHESVSLRFWLNNIPSDVTIFAAKESFNRMVKSYQYSKDKINAFKYLDLGRYSTLLGDMFPNCKFISIIKKRNSFVSTNEGKKFLDASEKEVLEIQRPLVEGQPIFHLDFDKFFTDFTYVNKVLNYLGSPNILRSQYELEFLKEEIGFDNKALES